LHFLGCVSFVVGKKSLARLPTGWSKSVKKKTGWSNLFSIDDLIHFFLSEKKSKLRASSAALPIRALAEIFVWGRG
jgi:hypothetical protein